MSIGQEYNAGYDYGRSPVDNIRGPRSLSTEHATAITAGAALLILIAIRRGFRGVNVGGVGVSIR